MKQEQFKMIDKAVVISLIILGKERGWIKVRVAKEKKGEKLTRVGWQRRVGKFSEETIQGRKLIKGGNY